MTIKRIDKIVCCIVLTLIVFFISTDIVKADTLACSYDTAGGTFKIYDVGTRRNGSGRMVQKFKYEFDAVSCDYSASSPCYFEKIENSSVAKYLDNNEYKVEYNEETNSYDCPRIYFSIEADNVTVEGQTSYGNYITISNKNISNEHLDSTVGNTILSDRDQYCEGLLSQLQQINEEYNGNYMQNLMNLKTISQKRYEDISLTEFNYVATYSSNATYYLEQLNNRIQNLDTSRISSCPEAKTLYNDLENKIEQGRSDIELYTNIIRTKERDAANDCASNDEYCQDRHETFSNDINNALVRIQELNLSGSGEGCSGILGDNVKEDIGEILSWIRIAAPLLVVILSVLDFSKAVLSGDDKALSKAVSNLVKRLIIAVALIFVPTILNFVISAVDKLAGGCSIGDLL